MAKRGGKRAKIAAVADARGGQVLDEAAIENAWRASRDLHVIANRLGMCRLCNEPPPAWLHKAVLDLADASVNVKLYAKQARSLVRYLAVREAHDSEGLSWDDAKVRAAEILRDQPARASPDRMWAEYKIWRRALRAAGVRDDDPGYRWVDLPDKIRG
jgi:hypothetical protein